VLTLHAFSRLQVKMAQPYRDEEGRCPYDMLLREGQVHCELSVVDPSNQYAPESTAWPVFFTSLSDARGSLLRMMCWA
jgi:hypothetical protein